MAQTSTGSKNLAWGAGRLLEKNLEDYSANTFRPVDDVLREVVDRAERNQLPPLHVDSLDGLTLEVMIRMAGYKKMVEVGTLAGYSGIQIARAIGPDGHLHTIEVMPQFAEVAKESFRKAGVEDRVTVHVGTAAEVLQRLAKLGPFDAVFIDADKENYPVYLDWAEENIRVGGAIFADNTFGFGHVWRDADTIMDNPKLKSQVAGLRKINARLASNPNYRATILPTNQGLTMAVRLK
ncbi:Catechol O-methyltransferase [Frankliniella fusca]|uniref:Catechol O-methyltransferase n=1 Tax=Frankliniella fusca TaxID=407009 RepID=A0AAE1LDY5_9NEOP|nr:Catechol O-methyltransferase [Frankliniella fusca]